MQRNYRIGNDDLPAFVALNADGTAIGSNPGGATGGPATIVDGGDVAQGAKADMAYTGNGAATIISVLKGVYMACVGATPAGSNVIGGVTVADGSNAAQGAKADASYTGTGAATVVSILKGIYAACIGATPAGSNVIGKVQVADGGDATQGAASDALATNSTSSWSVVALLKGVYAQLVLTVTGLNAPTPTGANVIGKVQVADGGDVAQGTTTDTAWASGAGTIVGVLKGLYGLLSGVLRTQAAIWYVEASNVVVAAGGTWVGPIGRATLGAGVPSSQAYFIVTLNSTASGTLLVGNGVYNTSFVVAANSPIVARVPAFGPGMSVAFAANGTAATINMFSGFTAS